MSERVEFIEDLDNLLLESYYNQDEVGRKKNINYSEVNKKLKELLVSYGEDVTNSRDSVEAIGVWLDRIIRSYEEEYLSEEEKIPLLTLKTAVEPYFVYAMDYGRKFEGYRDTYKSFLYARSLRAFSEEEVIAFYLYNLFYGVKGDLSDIIVLSEQKGLNDLYKELVYRTHFIYVMPKNLPDTHIVQEYISVMMEYLEKDQDSVYDLFRSDNIRKIMDYFGVPSIIPRSMLVNFSQ